MNTQQAIATINTKTLRQLTSQPIEGEVMKFEILDKADDWQARNEAYWAQPMHGLTQTLLHRSLDALRQDPHLPEHCRSIVEDAQAYLTHVWSLRHEIALSRAGRGDTVTLNWLAERLAPDACFTSKPSHEVAGRYGWKAKPSA